jgi:hypothetical protein
MAKSPRVEAELDKMPADIEVDIQFDADNTTITTEPGALTRTFYVPEELAKQTFNVPLPGRKAALDERPTELKADIQPETDHPALLAENMSDLGQTTLAASTIDMSAGKWENSFDNMPAAPQVDRQLNIDNPTPSTEPGDLTKMFYVGVDEIPAVPQVDSQLDPGNPAPLSSPESSAQCAQYSPTNTLEISVGELEGGFDEFEDIQLDTTEIDQDIDLAFNLPSTVESESTVDYDVAETARKETTPGITSTSVSNETPEPMLPEVQEEPFAVADDEFGLAREGTDDRPSCSEERTAGPEAGRISAPDVRADGKKI